MFPFYVFLDYENIIAIFINVVVLNRQLVLG